MLTLLRKSLYLAAGHRRWPWFLVIGLALAVSAVEAIGALLVFGLLGLVTNPQQPIEVPLIGDIRGILGAVEAEDMILWGAIAVAAFFIVRALIIVGLAYVQARVTQSAGARLASRLHRGYLTMPYVLYVGTNSSQQIRNLHVTVPLVVADVFALGSRAISEAIVVLVLGLVLVAASPLAMMIILLVLAPGILALNRFIRPRLQLLGRVAQDIAARSVKVLQETIQGLREVRAHQREEHFASVFASLSYTLAQNRTKRTILRTLPGTALETALVLFISTFLIVTIVSGFDIADALPVLGMFAYVGFRLKPSLNQILEGINAFRYSAAAVEDLYEDLRRAEAWQVPADAPATLIKFERSIELADVTFHYPGSPTPAIDDVSLVIGRGTSVGFVGPTGGGKSTLLDIIIGLLDPDQGSVLVDGTDIRTAGVSWLQRLGVVPQAPFLLDTTLRRNVALGARDDEIDDERLARVLAIAKLDDFVGELPNGVDTLLGERGVKLSGGQRQRVAIARALYRDPDVLVLDEGTAALDNRTEAELMAALGQHLRGRCTLLMVAHRLSTIRSCDVIHVVDRGRIADSGSYDDLVRESAHFKNLVR